MNSTICDSHTLTRRILIPSTMLMVASGFAGLGYQIVWTQQSALWLGHENASVLAVITAFFGGLAVGSFTLGARIERSAQALRWYAGCEVLIGMWAFVLTLITSPVSEHLLDITGVRPSPLWQWTVAFIGTFLLLLPATAAMGATLPAMKRVVEGPSIAPLYAANTLGAVLGVLSAAFYLVPTLGLTHTAYICIALNLLCGFASLAIFTPQAANVSRVNEVRNPSVLAQLAVTGFLGIGYEVIVVRVLSQVLEDTVYTFAMLLAIYLIGTALGAAFYRRTKLDHLLTALAISCLFGTLCLYAADALQASALTVLGPSMGAALSAEAFLALVAFGLPTFVMGMLFSDLCSRAPAFSVALGVNTLGAAAAPIVFGLLAFPTLGPKLCLLLVSCGYLALTTRRQIIPWIAVGAGLLLPALRFVEGGNIISYQDGAMASVSVVEDAQGVARLRINNRQQEGSSATRRVDSRQALLPVLLHPAPHRALFLGLGTGVTASAAAANTSIHVDAVELLPEVIEASRYFTQDTPIHLIAADARRYVRAADQHYDVIISDNFHPARSGSGALYTVEHFEAVRKRLDTDGVFCQWLPLHQLDLLSLRSIVQSFITVYPHGWAMLASNSLETPVIGLVGRADDHRFDFNLLGERTAPDIGIEDEYALLGSFVAGPNALKRFAGSIAANTDDLPFVAYHAPRVTYAPDSLPRDRLIALLRELSISPDELVAPTSNADVPQRLAAYWNARSRFVEAGRNVRPASNVEEMLAQVQEPLMTILRISPDFRPAYDPLIQMALALSKTNSTAARALLAELAAVQPARSEARRELKALNGSAMRASP